MSSAIWHVDKLKEFVADKKGIPTREELVALLKENIVEVTFTKLNGDERVMPCTLQESYLPPAKKDDPITQKKVRELNEEVVAVWVIDAKGFRSFRYDRLKSIRIIEDEQNET
ncbi:MAG: SH3 beta-barrel fold-containing protein [Euryarchaeota archaeon]|jgi:arginine repressor